MARFCSFWIPNFALITHPLYKATRGPEIKSLDWTKETNQAFQALNRTLATALALGITDLTKPFALYTAERKGLAIGTLTQKPKSEASPVAYISQQLNRIVLGWPGYLQEIADSTLLTEEATKITLELAHDGFDPIPVKDSFRVKRSYMDDWGKTDQTQGYPARKPWGDHLNPALLLPTELLGNYHSCEMIISHSL